MKERSERRKRRNSSILWKNSCTVITSEEVVQCTTKRNCNE